MILAPQDALHASTKVKFLVKLDSSVGERGGVGNGSKFTGCLSKKNDNKKN